MKIIPPMTIFSKKQWFLMASSIFGTCILIQYHFILEFSVIMKNNLPYYFVIFHLIALSIGAVFALKIFNKKLNHFTSYFIFNTTMTASFIVMILINQAWFIPIGLFIAGFSIGVLIGLDNWYSCLGFFLW